jgi:predicted TIM-barrel fold metal-dependent hydrolase
MRITDDGEPLPIPPTVNNPPRIAESTSATSVEATSQPTLAVMDIHNIVKGFLSGNLDYVYKWVAGAPNRFIPSSSIIGRPSDPSIDFLRGEYNAGRLEAMGEIWSQLAGLSPTDPALEPYFGLAEELDLPVLIHTAGLGPRLPDFRSSLGNPLLLEEVLVKHPRLCLWVENAGFPFLEEMTILMYQYPQVYADLSTITWIIPREAFHDYLRGLIRAGLGKRLIFGSDQMSWPEAIESAIEGIESADFLTEEQKRDIFYNNAVRFLRLEENALGLN